MRGPGLSRAGRPRSQIGPIEPFLADWSKNMAAVRPVERFPATFMTRNPRKKRRRGPGIGRIDPDEIAAGPDGRADTVVAAGANREAISSESELHQNCPPVGSSDGHKRARLMSAAGQNSMSAARRSF